MSDEFDGQGHALVRRSEIATQTALRLVEAAAGMRSRGPDPFDGLWFGWPRPLVAGKRRRQAVMQAHVRSPVDFRPLYRRRHPLIPKALGIFGSAGVRLWRLTGDERFRVLALDAIETLDADHSAGEEAWGYWWDMQTRWSFYAAGSPNVVVTAFAAHGLQDAAEAFGVRRYSERAHAAAQWVRNVLWLSMASTLSTTQAAACSFTTPICSRRRSCTGSSRPIRAPSKQWRRRSRLRRPMARGRTERAPRTSASSTLSTLATYSAVWLHSPPMKWSTVPSARGRLLHEPFLRLRWPRGAVARPPATRGRAFRWHCAYDADDSLPLRPGRPVAARTSARKSAQPCHPRRPRCSPSRPLAAYVSALFALVRRACSARSLWGGRVPQGS